MKAEIKVGDRLVLTPESHIEWYAAGKWMDTIKNLEGPIIEVKPFYPNQEGNSETNG